MGGKEKDKYGDTPMGEYEGQALPESTVNHLQDLDAMLADAHGKVMTSGPCTSCKKHADWVYNAHSGMNHCSNCGADSSAMDQDFDYP